MFLALYLLMIDTRKRFCANRRRVWIFSGFVDVDQAIYFIICVLCQTSRWHIITSLMRLFYFPHHQSAGLPFWRNDTSDTFSLTLTSNFARGGSARQFMTSSMSRPSPAAPLPPLMNPLMLFWPLLRVLMSSELGHLELAAGPTRSRDGH